jgi:hypothetical protein
MELTEYMRGITPQEREKFAARCKTTVEYLYQIAGGHRNAGARLARRIHDESGRKVDLHKLRPDIFEAA